MYANLYRWRKDSMGRHTRFLFDREYFDIVDDGNYWVVDDYGNLTPVKEEDYGNHCD